MTYKQDKIFPEFMTMLNTTELQKLLIHQELVYKQKVKPIDLLLHGVSIN